MIKSSSVLLSGAFALAMLFAWQAAPSIAQQSDPATRSEYPLVGDEGQRLPKHTIKLLGPIDKLPGVVVVGNAKGTETVT